MKQTVRRSAGTVSVDTDALSRLMADVAKNRNARVHVGVLGKHTVRAEGNALSNADIGAIHEFGVLGGYADTAQGQRRRKLGGPNAAAEHRNIPARSWLRMPVLTHLPDQLKKLPRGLWQQVIVKRGLRGALGVLGAAALASIQESFATGGFGSWAPLAPFTIRQKLRKSGGKGAAAILIDTAQLRQSVTSEVVG